MTTKENLSLIRQDILKALAHSEASEGLYLENLEIVHEEEERIPVRGTQLQILECLKELISEERVTVNDSGEKVIFLLSQ